MEMRNTMSKIAILTDSSCDIPQELAYGPREQREIKPFSALIFKIELVEVKD